MGHSSSLDLNPVRLLPSPPLYLPPPSHHLLPRLFPLSCPRSPLPTPTTQSTANIALTSQGSEWLWTCFSLFTLAALTIALVGHNRPPGARAHHHLALVILLITAVSYWTLASNLGWTPIVRFSFPFFRRAEQLRLTFDLLWLAESRVHPSWDPWNAATRQRSVEPSHSCNRLREGPSFLPPSPFPNVD